MLRFARKLASTSKTPSVRRLSQLPRISNALVDVKPDVRDALQGQKSVSQPVVALESTIITHGMPYPHNLETALEVERIVRQEGAIPATIAIIDGRIKVGLSPDELARLAKIDSGKQTIKTSRRDMAYVLSQGLDGGTTVAGTLMVAGMVGIRVFATGGIGGVHRGVQDTMDVSADLVELGRSPVAVISSGIKSILDIPRTLEYLETQGVCVASYQCPTLDFPAFYTRSSGCKAAYNLASARDAARMISVSQSLGLGSGFVIGVPIPEPFALDRKLMDDVISQALAEADRQGVRGKEVTPFILSAVSQLTRGKSLESNMALIKNNARVAAEIAVELCRVEGSSVNSESVNEGRSESVTNRTIQRVPVVIGGSVVDTCIMVKDADLKVSS
ncbi:pseudouridine-5'-phosphate glycosidase-like [Uranotaenia lowii]|uniref:pseudouridine-5'-phosphate glycosidase-like n=1 Tax=Uranotaenia lowii TaxID=190385 RepID=UPI002479F597|nr:pseudouridine-5'-phosphate glycosidase-like [Uranotaenia lowii]